jgi:hypothetical protein
MEFARLGSKRLQLNKGGGATPFLLQGLVCGVANSIPTAPTNLNLTEGFEPEGSNRARLNSDLTSVYKVCIVSYVQPRSHTTLEGGRLV